MRRHIVGQKATQLLKGAFQWYSEMTRIGLLRLCFFILQSLNFRPHVKKVLLTKCVRLILLHRFHFWLCYHFSLKIIFLMLLATLEFPKPPQTGYFGNFRQFSTILATIEAISWIAFLRFWRFEIFAVNCQIKLVPNKKKTQIHSKNHSLWIIDSNTTVRLKSWNFFAS